MFFLFFHLLFIIQARDGPGWIHIPRLRIPGNFRLDCIARPQPFPSSYSPLAFFPCLFCLYPSMILPLPFPMLSSLLSPAPVPFSSPLLWLRSPLIWTTSQMPPLALRLLLGSSQPKSLSFPAAPPSAPAIDHSSTPEASICIVCLCPIPRADLQCLDPNKFSAKVPFLKLKSFHCVFPSCQYYGCTSSGIRLLFYRNIFAFYFTCQLSKWPINDPVLLFFMVTNLFSILWSMFFSIAPSV